MSETIQSQKAEYPYGQRPPVMPKTQFSYIPGLSRELAGLWLLLSVCALQLLADVLIVPLLHVFDHPEDWGAVCVFACVGVIVGQAGVLTAWLVWGTQPLIVRLALHWGLALVAVACWLVGLRAAQNPRVFWEAVSVVVPALPLVSLAAQAPLWIVRQWYGWRLVKTGEPEVMERPLLIRDLMIATLVAGISLAAARGVDGGRSQNDEFWPGWGTAVATAAVLSSIALLPAGAGLLGARRFALGCAIVGAYAMAPIGALWFVFLYFDYTLPGSPSEDWELICLSILFLSCAALLALAALAARTCGYALTLRRRSAHDSSKTA